MKDNDKKDLDIDKNDLNKYRLINNANKYPEISMNKVPILKGCPNEVCFCTGKCKEIIGYRDKLPGEY